MTEFNYVWAPQRISRQTLDIVRWCGDGILPTVNMYKSDGFWIRMVIHNPSRYAAMKRRCSFDSIQPKSAQESCPSFGSHYIHYPIMLLASISLDICAIYINIVWCGILSAPQRRKWRPTNHTDSGMACFRTWFFLVLMPWLIVTYIYIWNMINNNADYLLWAK